MEDIVVKIKKIMEYKGWYDFEINSKYNKMIIINEGVSYLSSYTYKVYMDYFKKKEKINIVNLEFENIEKYTPIKYSETDYNYYEINSELEYGIYNSYENLPMYSSNLHLYLPEKSEAFIILDYFSEFAIAFGSDDFIEYFLENYYLSYENYIEYIEVNKKDVFSKYKERLVYKKHENNVFCKYPYFLNCDEYEKTQTVEEVKERLKDLYPYFTDQILINESEVYFEFYEYFYMKELMSRDVTYNKYIKYNAINKKEIYYSELLCFFQNLAYELELDYTHIIEIFDTDKTYCNKKVYSICTITYAIDK
ncbi:hypothetical protein STFE110948_01790 [Streptobacillus felis]|uniref:Uncharacterized protein n=1 Tax=Streptobacillus felis TaxID=1384509 RepID=A0A7Z0PGJ2_9FUSO|nr:hypothetical protein [Streptobacillus felis]NYV28293.1 hypothetical protein [Streptobacillus felis]